MSAATTRLVSLLRELFQLDQPDLDFGLYRVLHARAAEIERFLTADLLPLVREAFATYQPADKATLQAELDKLTATITGAGMDAEQSPKVRELRERLTSEAVDVASLENDVFDHLYGFFRRYYAEGDFLARRVYKAGVYAIPYEGEEVKLHWANRDQYYIKTSEYLRDYAFRLRPDAPAGADPRRVHFRLADAAEGEHGNVKAAEGAGRVFVLRAGAAAWALEPPAPGAFAELTFFFEYRPATLADWPAAERDGKTKAPTQDKLRELAAERILALTDAALAPWLADLRKPHVRPDGTVVPDSTRLRVHLDRYTKRNTFDYFIHKDLGGFLRRELDFYLKNEVLHLDDIEADTAPRVEQYLSKLRVLRRVAHHLIDFLAQLEDFQKKLWLKKKFVVETHWCLTLDRVPTSFYPQVAANEAQREEWVQLFGIDTWAGDAATPAYAVPLTDAFLRAHPGLVLDTRHFPAAFTETLLSEFGDLDEQTDGLLIHGENFQALNLLQARYAEQIDCVYIDPPYNTGSDGFPYKDSYQHSSWLAMMDNRLSATHRVLGATGAIFISINEEEHNNLVGLQQEVFGAENQITNIIWQRKYAPANDAKWFSDDHDFITLFAKSKEVWRPTKLKRSEEQNAAYKNPDKDKRGPWKGGDYTSNKSKEERKTLWYPIIHPKTGEEIWPSANGNATWRYTREQHQKNVENNQVWWGPNQENKVPSFKRFLSDVGDIVPRSIWSHTEVGHNQDGIRVLRDLLPQTSFISPKPPTLIERVCQIAPAAVTLDYFAGSGTTGHAVINLNREDGGQRKFILVEMGEYFDSVTLPRLKKVIYSPEWKDGRPKRAATAEERARSPRLLKVIRLESYEDALNNLEMKRAAPVQATLFREAAPPEVRQAKQAYVLRYLLDVETAGSRSLLDVAAFHDPTAYTLTVKAPGTDESRPVAVDLIETFHYLLGLRVREMSAPQVRAADFARDAEGRLTLKGRLRKPTGTEPTWWLRAITGELPNGQGRALIIWRKQTGDPERDNLVLDEWFRRHDYSVRDQEFDVIYVNGDNNLENLRQPDDTWKVRLTEEAFHQLMFAGA